MYTVLVTESVSVSDALVAGQLYGVSVAESVSVSDALAAARRLPVDVADTVSVLDAVAGRLTAVVTPVDTVGVTDGLGASARLVGAVSDTVSVLDALTPALRVPVTVSDALTVNDAVGGQVTARPTLNETVGVSDSLLVSQGSLVSVSVTDTVGVSDAVSVVQYHSLGVLDLVRVADEVSAGIRTEQVVTDTVVVADTLGGSAIAVPLGNGRGVSVLFSREVPWEAAVDPVHYLFEGDGYPLTPLSVTIDTLPVDAGSAAVILGPYEVDLADHHPPTPLVGRYLTLASDLNPITVRVVSMAGSVARVDRPLFPDPGPLGWSVRSGAIGAVVTTPKMTLGASYTLTAFGPPIAFTGSAPRPRLLTAEYLSAQGALLLTFTDDMRGDPALTDPREYAVTGPTSVEIRRVVFLADNQVRVETSGMGFGTYTVTVNATGTPKDLAGNPMDPVFNQVIFGGDTPEDVRSIFVDKGPIARPPLTLLQGTGVTILGPNEVRLTGAGLGPTLVGRELVLVGTTRNDGAFPILALTGVNTCRVLASFSTPDVGAAGAAWVVQDARQGQIADDPAHVVVRINGVPTPVEAVVGLLGQIVLPAAPAPTDDVQVDYSWICNPQVECTRLNSEEFRFNSLAQVFPGGPTHTYPYQNTLLVPEDNPPSAVIQEGSGALVTAPNTVTLPAANVLANFVGLTLFLGGVNAGVGFRVTARLSATSVQVSPNPLVDINPSSWTLVDDQNVLLGRGPQPLLRGLKYRAFERAYTAVLNDPTTLVFNTPQHTIAYAPLQRPLDQSFVSYDPLTLPENDPVSPWTREGTGTALLLGAQLVVTDTTTGPFPGGEPLYWTRPLDTSFPQVFAMTWSMFGGPVPTYQGVWSGIAVGFSGPERALVVGYLDDGGIKKLGILKAGAGNDPSDLTAWTGGLDVDSNPTLAPAIFDWTLEHAYRVNRTVDGWIRVYLDGEVVESLRVLESDLPFLEELNDPFRQIQGAFFGSLSREAQSTSTWSFVRYGVFPTNPTQIAPTVYTSYEGTTFPEVSVPPWTPVGYHGTETLLPSDMLLVDSTSATTAATEQQVGLVGGDFRAFVHLEPLLSVAADVALDVGVQLRSHTHGPTPNGLMAAIDDGQYLVQLSLVASEAAPKFSYGGRSLPTESTPVAWSSLGSAGVAMVGRTLRITDDTIADGRVYYINETALPGDADRVMDPNTNFVVEARMKVLSATADPAGFAGVTVDAYDSQRALGFFLEEIAGVRYVTFQSEGVPIVAGRFAFDWLDGQAHTYRMTKTALANTVSLLVDNTMLGVLDYTDFATPPFSPVSTIAFGSATVASQSALSQVDWSYANVWRVVPGTKRYAGLWNGGATGTLRDFHLPALQRGSATVAGNVLTDPLGDFVARGVTSGDRLVIDTGPNAGVYFIAGATPTFLVVVGVFPSTPSQVDYRIPREVDWTAPHRYRMVRAPDGAVSLFLDAETAPLVRADYSPLSLPPSSAGVPRQLSGGLPSIVWGAVDPTNLSQSAWDFVRYGITSSPVESRIVPPHHVFNQRNTIASAEHLFTDVPHPHTDFWSSSDGIPPQGVPDFLRDPSVLAYTLLNQGTPLVPSTQTAEVRGITATDVFVSSLNNIEDVLNNDGDFTLNDGTIKTSLVYPPDVLYSNLEVIETVSGVPDLLTPFCDDCPGPTFRGVQYQNEVCLTYTAVALPEDTLSPTPWERVSDVPANVSATVFSGVLTYSTTGLTRTVYRNNTPLPDSPGLITEVTFRMKVAQDATFGLGDSQVRLGFSATPNMTVALAFITAPLGDRYVLVTDLNNGNVLGGIPFDWYDGAMHTYRLVRNPGMGTLQVFVDS